MIAGAEGLVLAGGASRRFGSNKALASWNGRERLVERAHAVMKTLFARNLVLVKEPARFAFLEACGAAVRRDLFDDAHPLGGIVSGLRYASAEWVFVRGCDMPLLRPPLVSAMWAARGGYDAVVPVWKGRREPLCAFYSTRCLGALEGMAREKRFKLQELFEAVRTRFFQEREVLLHDPDGLSFRDVDTREDLREVRAAA